MGICMNAKEIKDKFRKYFMVVLLVFCSAFVVTNYKTTTVQAASTSTSIYELCTEKQVVYQRL